MNWIEDQAMLEKARIAQTNANAEREAAGLRRARVDTRWTTFYPLGIGVALLILLVVVGWR